MGLFHQPDQHQRVFAVTKYLKTLRNDRFLRKLTLVVIVAFFALILFFGGSIRTRLCKTRLRKPIYINDFAGFADAQRLFCSDEYLLPKWDLAYHQGGNEPWVPKVNGVVESEIPPDCEVDQVHVLARHAERYPTTDTGKRHLDLLTRLKSFPRGISKPLAFAKEWEYFTTPGSPEFESLIRAGPYAGTKAAENTGRYLRSRYNHLLRLNRTKKVWSASSPRDVETAEWFAKGFFKKDWRDDGTVQIETISESPVRKSNTLTPGKTCLAYQADSTYGRQMGYKALDNWQRTFTKPIIDRLTISIAGFEFSAMDIYSMFEMCSFETLVCGTSPWCTIFTQSEWLDFEYGRDLLHFYRAGPGNRYAGAMGLIWLEAVSRNLQNRSRDAEAVYASFVHDGDILPVVTALGVFDEPSDLVSSAPIYLPTTYRKDDRTWKTSDVVPMGGRLVLERIKCDKPLHQPQSTSFVRLLINDGHVPLETTRPEELLEHDMTVDAFADMLRRKKERFGDFRRVCKIGDDGPDGIDFLVQ